MISKLMKMVIVLIILFLLIGAVIAFWKKAKNQTKSQTKEQLKKLKIFRLDALVLAMVLCLIYSLVLYFDTTKQASAMVGLNYAEASFGQNANGTRYNMSEIICDEVLERTIKKGGFEDISVDDLKSCFSVARLNQGNSFSEDSYHISTEFSVSYLANKKTQKYDSDTLLQLLCNSYRDYYFDKYVNDFNIQTDDLQVEIDGLDYLDAVTLLSKKANMILNYLYGLQQKNSSFISSKGATFASVASKVYTLDSVQIGGTLYSFVLQNGISHDTVRLLNRFDYLNVQAGFEKQKLDQSYKITMSAIAKYDKDMARIVLVPTWDNVGQYYMGRTIIGVDTLSMQSVAYSQQVASIEKSIQDNALKLDKFGDNAGNTQENKQTADALILDAEKTLQKLAEEARHIGQEYYSNQMNQCISAEVYAVSLFAQMKKIGLVFLGAYIAVWAKRSSARFALSESE